MIYLIPLNRAASPWTQDAIDRPIIVPLLCQGSLHLRGHVAGRSVAITEDRAVVNIVAVIGIISVGGIPPAAIPIPVTATVTDEAVIAVPPPTAVVTLPPIPALRRTIRPLISGAFVMFPRIFVPLRIVVGDNVVLFGFLGALDVLLVVIGVRGDVRLSLLVLVIAVGYLLIAAWLRGDMLLTRLRADMRLTRLRANLWLSSCLRADAPIACLPPAARLCRRRLGGLRFFLLLFLLIVGLRGLDRC